MAQMFGDIVAVMGDILQLFTEPPLAYFVAMSVAAVAIGAVGSLFHR